MLPAKTRIELTDTICSELAKVLNELHGTSYSVRFWRLVISSHVSFLISRKHLLETAVLDSPVPLDTINATSIPKLKDRMIRFVRYLVYSLKTARNRRRLYRLLRENASLAFGFHHTTEVVGSTVAVLPDYYPILLPFRNRRLRARIKEIASRYDCIFMKNVILQLPKVNVENFRRLHDSIELFEPDKKVFHVSLVKSAFVKLLLAKYSEYGTSLYFYQPGGFFGELKYHPGYHHISQVADKFMTWGWKINECDEPSAAHRLAKFESRYRAHGAETMYDCVLCFAVHDPEREVEVRRQSMEIVSNIDIHDRRRIVARPRPRFRKLDNSWQLHWLSPTGVLIDDGKSPLADIVARSKVVIQLSHPSTNFLECLYVDHPVMAILTNDEPTDLVKPFYAFFLEVGVFHPDGVSLANHYNRVCIERWWADVVKHPTYQAYKNTFLRRLEEVK